MAPTCFISYSWDDKEHKQWVLRLATSLQSAGVHVFLDQWDIHPGMDLTKYMETSIRESNYVLLVCTSIFATKANARKGGVGYEQMVVTGEIFQQTASEKKFIPILRRGSREEAVPSFLGSRITVDFRSEADYQNSLEELLRHMHAIPIAVRPPLGPAPTYVTSATTGTAAPRRVLAPVPLDLNAFGKLQQFAYASDGLDLSESDAKKWAEERMDSWQNVDIEVLSQRFKVLREFAYGPDGLNLAEKEAIKWAEERMIGWQEVNIESMLECFEALRQFAYGSDGLDLSEREAIKWAEERMFSWQDIQLPVFIKRFRELRNFAYSASGLNLSDSAANEWALKRACSEYSLK